MSHLHDLGSPSPMPSLPEPLMPMPDPCIPPTRPQQQNGQGQPRPTQDGFTTALENLIRTLRNTATCLARFQSEFARETVSIRPYASEAVLEELWTSRIFYYDNPWEAMGMPVARSPGSSGSDEGIEWCFGECFVRIERGYDAVMMLTGVPELVVDESGSDRGDGGKRGEVRSLDGLVVMLEEWYRSWDNMVAKIYDHSSHTADLVREIEALLGCLERSRSVWAKGAME